MSGKKASNDPGFCPNNGQYSGLCSLVSARNQFLSLKLIRSKWHYVQVSYTEVYQHWTSDVESTVGNFCMLLSKVWFSLCQFSRS